MLENQPMGYHLSIAPTFLDQPGPNAFGQNLPIRPAPQEAVAETEEPSAATTKGRRSWLVVRRLFAHAPLKAGLVATPSARALKLEKPILASLAHDGMRPQRIGSRRRLPSLEVIAGSISVGGTFQRGV